MDVSNAAASHRLLERASRESQLSANRILADINKDIHAIPRQERQERASRVRLITSREEDARFKARGSFFHAGKLTRGVDRRAMATAEALRERSNSHTALFHQAGPVCLHTRKNERCADGRTAVESPQLMREQRPVGSGQVRSETRGD